MFLANFKPKRSASALRGFSCDSTAFFFYYIAVLSIFPSINYKIIKYYFTYLLLVHNKEIRG